MFLIAWGFGWVLAPPPSRGLKGVLGMGALEGCISQGDSPP